MRENIERGLGPPRERRGSSPRSSRRAACRARTPTRSSSATPSAPPTSAGRCGSSSSPIPTSRRCWPRRASTRASTTTPSCATSPTIIARLDALERACRSAASEVAGDARCCADAFLRSGKVRDLYELDDGSAAARRARPDQRLRRRAADADPRQGPRPDRTVAVLVRRDGRRSSRTTCSRPTRGRCRAAASASRRADELRGRMMICRRAGSCRSRSSSAATSRARGWKEYRATGAVCGIPLPPGCARATGCPSRSSRPSTKAEDGEHDENIDVRADGRAGRRASSRERVARASRSRCTARGAGIAERGRDHPRRHEVRVRDRDPRRRADPHRRGADARLVALLGAAGVRARPAAGRATTSSSSATGWRRSLGQDARPARRCPPTSWPGTRARYVEAFERITGASFDRYLEEDVIAR